MSSSPSGEEMERTLPTAERFPSAEKTLKRAFDETTSEVLRERRRKSRTNSIPSHRTNESLRFLIVHKVVCHQHSYHDREPIFYVDTPRLYRGDDRLSRLRGTMEIEDDIFSKDFAQANEDLGFVVIRTYKCGPYHESVSDRFKQIPIPENVADVLKKYTRQLTILDYDTTEAHHSAESIVLVSEVLHTAMELVRFAYPAYFQQTNVAMDSPYAEFYHGQSILTPDTLDLLGCLSNEQKSHIKLLLNYILSSCSKDYEEASKQFSAGKVSRKHFAKLFCPEEIVVRSTDDGPVAYFLKHIQKETKAIRLECWNWGFDGQFYKSHIGFDVPRLSGKEEISIVSLPVYPLRVVEPQMRFQLYGRGKAYWEFKDQMMVEYHSTDTGLQIQPASQRYMIDFRMYKKMHPEPADATDTARIYGQGIEMLKEPPADPFLILLPATIRGFRFHDKKWSTLAVERIRHVRWNDEIFDRRLVLKGHKKELIKALVTVHTSSQPAKMDIVDGKGRGLILLLHGGPGTGKTLTAESIAEYAKRPLYRVTCGDIGTDPENVEKYLESVLYIGTLWRCVVLLDEADVFLEERVPTDLQRNALVSVFLRTLEYFEGILVLTSNRVGTFDEAFKSRVQLAMHYPPLDESSRWQVWSILLKDLLEEDEKSRYEEMKEQISFLARHKLNGRQIRNTINTARQLARYRKADFAYEHLEIAVDVVNEFELYIDKAKGHTDEEYAKAQGHR